MTAGNHTRAFELAATARTNLERVDNERNELSLLGGLAAYEAMAGQLEAARRRTPTAASNACWAARQPAPPRQRTSMAALPGRSNATTPKAPSQPPRSISRSTAPAAACNAAPRPA